MDPNQRLTVLHIDLSRLLQSRAQALAKDVITGDNRAQHGALLEREQILLLLARAIGVDIEPTKRFTCEVIALNRACGREPGVDPVETDIEGIGGGALLAHALKRQDGAVLCDPLEIPCQELRRLFAAPAIDEDVACHIALDQVVDLARDRGRAARR